MTAVYTAANLRSKLMRWSVPRAHLHHEPTNKYNQSRIYIQIGFFPLFTPIPCPSARPRANVFALHGNFIFIIRWLIDCFFFPCYFKRNFPFHFISGYGGACLADTPRVFHRFLAGEIMTIDTVTFLHAYRCLLVTISVPFEGRRSGGVCVRLICLIRFVSNRQPALKCTSIPRQDKYPRQRAWPTQRVNIHRYTPRERGKLHYIGAGYR